MDIICKNYLDESKCKYHRDFLEQKIGIPSHWFDMALLYQPTGSIHQNHTLYISQDSFSKNLATFEDLVIPKILFDGDTDSCNEFIRYLDALHTQIGESFSMSLSGLFLQYLKLCEEIIALHNDNKEMVEHIPNLEVMHKDAEKIKSAIFKLQQRKQKSGSDSKVPRYIVLAEFQKALTLLITHVNVLKSGGSIFDASKGYERPESRSLKLLSKLGFMSKNNNDVALPFTDALRGKAGIEIEIGS